MSCRWWLVGLLFLAWAPLAHADHPDDSAPFWRNWRLVARTCPSVGCCPDDYDRKAGPALITIPRCGDPDDYCRKPTPCIPAVPRCGGPDDYCRKALPCLLCPPLSPYLQCGTPATCGECSKR
jgi:hypothetical protein